MLQLVKKAKSEKPAGDHAPRKSVEVLAAFHRDAMRAVDALSNVVVTAHEFDNACEAERRAFAAVLKAEARSYSDVIGQMDAVVARASYLDCAVIEELLTFEDFQRLTKNLRAVSR